MERKKELRKYIAYLKALQEPSDTKLQSAKILALLEKHPLFKAANIILLYYSLNDEVNTHCFIKKWSTKKQILLPAVVGNNLKLRKFSRTENMGTNAYGIKEPIGEKFKDYASIELIIVPGVAFDLSGNRLGRGKGYYDRLLPNIPKAYKVGICFQFQIVEKIPAEPLDVQMDTIITTNENKLSHPYHSLPPCDRE